MAHVVKKDHGIMGQGIVYYTCKEQTNKYTTQKERKENMENAILRAIESGIKERAYETIRQLSELVVNDYRFTDEAKDFADQLLTELENN